MCAAGAAALDPMCNRFLDCFLQPVVVPVCVVICACYLVELLVQDRIGMAS